MKHTRPEQGEKIKAYSYIRMSSARQIDGDSLRRQLEDSELYAETHGLDLDTSLRDMGVSAFDGSNIQYGALGKFLDMVGSGKIRKGSYLLVESLDRLSRDNVLDALELFIRIINAGIVLVTIADLREYSRASVTDNWTQLIVSLAIMSRAHEESATKAKRLRDAWSKKRRLIHQEKLTARAPHWLILSDDRTHFTEHPERAPVVRRIFREYVNGIGQGTIAKRLNEEGIPSFGKARNQDKSDGWHGGTVSKIIPNRAVTGWYQPHKLETVTEIIEINGEKRSVRRKVRVPTGDPIPDYFPRIIDEDLWLKAQHIGATKLTQYRGMGWQPNAAGPKGKYYSNIFSGFCQCGTCGAAYIFKPAGVRSVSVLRCAKERRGMCDNPHREKYERLEKGMVEFVGFFTAQDTRTPEIKELERQIAAQHVRKADLEQRIKNLLDKMEEGQSVNDRLTDREAELSTVKVTIQELQKRLSGLEVTANEEERQQTFRSFYEHMQAVPEKERYAFRAQVAQRLREVIERIVVRPDGWVEVSRHLDKRKYLFRDGRFQAMQFEGKVTPFSFEQRLGRVPRLHGD